MPPVSSRRGESRQSCTVDNNKGLAGGVAGASASYIGMCPLFCESAEASQPSLGPKVQEIMTDIPHFTGQSPVTQISEVVVG
jgi:uncharacterized protein (TIGR02118 family)